MTAPLSAAQTPDGAVVRVDRVLQEMDFYARFSTHQSKRGRRS